MVKKENKYFKCTECNMVYKNKSLAEKCEDWCRKYHSCNTEIIKYAVGQQNEVRK